MARLDDGSWSRVVTGLEDSPSANLAATDFAGAYLRRSQER